MVLSHLPPGSQYGTCATPDLIVIEERYPGSGRHVQLLEDVVQVNLDRGLGDRQRLGDLPVAVIASSLGWSGTNNLCTLIHETSPRVMQGSLYLCRYRQVVGRLAETGELHAILAE